MKKVALLALVLSFSCLCAAQQRAPLFGRVLDGQGRPLAGATVTLVEDDVDLVAIDPVDVLRVRTGENGRFVAQALRGCRYTAFAVGPVADGKALVSETVPDLSCGMAARLRATVTGYARRVQLPATTAWGEAEDLRVRLRWKRCPGHFVDLEIDERGGVDVPASSVVAEVFLVDVDGRRLGRMWIPPKPGQGDAELPAMREMPVDVVDPQGRPVAGASVTYVRRDSHQDAWGLIAFEHVRGPSFTTDARGHATVKLQMWSDPFVDKPDTFVFVAHKEGYAEGASGWVHHEAFVDWKVVDKHAKPRIRITLPKPRAVEAQAMRAKFAGRDLRLFVGGTVSQVNGNMQMHHYLHRAYDVKVAADGAWRTETPIARAGNHVLRVPPVDGRPVVLAPSATPNVLVADDELQPLSIELTDESGGPGVGAQVLLVPRVTHPLHYEHAVRLVTDQAGRLEVLLQEDEWCLVAMTETGWIAAELAEWPPQKAELQLAPKPSRRVRVLGADGKPVEGAKFEPGNFRSGPGGPGIPGILAQLGWNSVGAHVRRVATDANGEVTLRWMPWPDTDVTVFAWQKSFRNRSDQQRLFEDDGPLIFRLR